MKYCSDLGVYRSSQRVLTIIGLLLMVYAWFVYRIVLLGPNNHADHLTLNHKHYALLNLRGWPTMAYGYDWRYPRLHCRTSNGKRPGVGGSP
jgi:hypothetical protein